MATLRLYHYWRSSSSWRVRWAFEIKKIDCELVPVSLLDGEVESPTHRARNPMGYVPVIEFLKPGTPFQFLAESLAIIEWAEERYPSPPLLPKIPEERARVRHLSELINSGIQPLQNPPVTDLHSANRDEQVKWVQHWIHNGFESYEKLVRETAGKLSFGDHPSMADLCLIPQCYAALRFHVDLTKFPTIHRIYQHALTLDTCIASHPDRYKPADT